VRLIPSVCLPFVQGLTHKGESARLLRKIRPERSEGHILLIRVSPKPINREALPLKEQQMTTSLNAEMEAELEAIDALLEASGFPTESRLQARDNYVGFASEESTQAGHTEEKLMELFLKS